MLLIGVYLLIVDVLITLCTVILLGGSLLIFMRVFRKTLSKAGRTNQKYQGRMIKWVNQSLGGIKEVKVSKGEQFFIDAYARNGFEYVKAQRRYSFLNQLPKPFIETVCIVGMMGIIIFVLKSGREANAFIPQIAVFAMAAFRLMPSMSRINTYLNAILFYKASIDLIFKDLKQMDDMTENEAMERGVTLGKSIDSIHVQDVSYQYPGAESCVFEHVDFNIPIGKSIAFIGPSGSGKTTIADLLLGILRPEKGEILAGGLNINENPKWWSGKLGYIPQFIYLSDEDIRSNVAFGIAEDQISDEQVWKVLEQAQLKEFVQSLPDKLDTFIGERGIRLSGGQRQRIGIARALYHNPEILVLDEATSSLDNETEQAVMDAIETLHGKMTLIIIAHRLSTIKNCDIIYEVRDKKIISGAPRI